MSENESNRFISSEAKKSFLIAFLFLIIIFSAIIFDELTPVFFAIVYIFYTVFGIIYFLIIGGAVISYWLFERLIIHPIYGYGPRFWSDGIGVYIGAIIGFSLIAIPLFGIMNRVVKEPHKKRKIFLSFIALYLVLGMYYLYIFYQSAHH